MSDAKTTLVEVPMPQFGVSVTEGTVLEWRHEIGDEIAIDEPLCDISTDKVDSEVLSPVAGRLAEVLIEAGTTVDVGVPLARVEAPEGSGGEAADDGDTGAVEVVGAVPAATNGPGDDDPTPRRRYSPLVTRMAADHGIDLASLTGTGIGGRVSKADVERAIADGSTTTATISSQATPRPSPPTAAASPSPVPSANGVPEGAVVEPLSRMRQTIARHMIHSRATAAHCHTWIEVDMTAVEAARKRVGLTALPFVAEATVRTLVAHPALNAWLDGNERTLHSRVNLGIAVSLESDGLIVPVVADAQNLKVGAIDQRIRELAGAAREGALAPQDVADGTFTITSQGRYGTLMSAPIINQPQVGILDLQTIAKRPVVVTADDGSDAIAIRSITILGLSWDHRAIDGAQAAEFLAALRDRLQDPPES
jgi:pyruvate/2-oxoglutarate dehydrogenase complex dihydrolipoamide acyltransferase (E2) component